MKNLQSIISSHISTLYWDTPFSPALSAPPRLEHGEYCFGVFTLAKPLGKSPNVIAEEIATILKWDTEYFTQVNVIGGYVNLSCTAKIWLQIMDILWRPVWHTKNWKTIVVDYIGANAGKPLHIGHICTPSVGQSICNIYRHLGYDVIGDSHFGDWGGIFGKLIYQWKKQSSHTEISLSYLVGLYQDFHVNPTEQDELWAREEFKKITEWDIENIELWKKFTAISGMEIEKKLELLNIKATYNIGESFYEWLNLPRPNNEDYPDLQFTMKNIVAELIEKWVATQNEDGSVGVIFPEETKIPSCVLQKKDGTGLYLTSDLAAIKYRMTNGWNPSKLVYSVDVRQQLHLKQAFTISKMAWPELTDGVEFFHAFNGFIKLKEWAMSTRHGTVIALENLITEGSERAAVLLAEKWRTGDHALSPEDIEAITIGAIKYSYLSQDREKDITFDWDKALSFEGNSGPYIQYACVRAAKVEKSWIENRESKIDVSSNNDLRITTYDTALIRTLAEMEQKIQTTADTYKPHTLALYCYDLAVCFNSFYVHTPKILEETDTDLRDLRLQLCRLTAEKLTLGFDLLAIKMPSEM
jgi:arginyl-tRNA synthetase